MAYEIPVTQARAELADLINRVVYGGERVVVTRHGKPLVALVSAADLERLEEAQEHADGHEHAEGQEHVEGQHTDGQIITSVAAVHDTGAAAPRERHRFGITAEHRGPNAS
ncbi:type II toxin-antitoxin system Phd/YefM family antitoxin [Streptomyces olivaceus]|uniref:type II toxin-antitoxin system Phd/YefM family antitoxin n=1 Tax=Streptomyces olivaceus TaxID=47716 RepID=UPI001884E914|nr:type II toxin-antitoxin system Phd/YefM family antitoxin [Streptomyces olivaceus]